MHKTRRLHTKLRRIALDQQGLLRVDSFGGGPAKRLKASTKNGSAKCDVEGDAESGPKALPKVLRETLRAIEQIGYVQIDTISVVERAHHHVLHSRLPNYKPEVLDQLVAQRKVFEYWSHAAAWLPMGDYRFALPRMQDHRDGKGHWGRAKDARVMRAVLERISEEGPLRARDFEDTRRGKKQWWDWKPAKRALEQLFMQGDLMVTRREGFQKVYDLTERVLPADVDTRTPTLAEYADYLIDSCLRAFGFANQKNMHYLRKGKDLREAIGASLRARVAAGKLTTVDLAPGSVVYINPNLLERRTPLCPRGVRILSPFDNLLIQRQRGQQVFDFDYKIECYVPAAKRQFGYFCLPILYRDELVGRVDCKAHRKQRRLQVITQHIEKPVDEGFASAMTAALQNFAAFNGCEPE